MRYFYVTEINGMNYTSKAPAKINIGLRILSKRKDGYHNIETIFYPIKLYDIVKVYIKKMLLQHLSIKVTTDSPELKNEKRNICYKAAKLFFKKSGIKGYRIKINIKKNIPIGAGLGGGSSDGAIVLRILCHYFKKTPQSVNRIAGQIGSDVLYFFNDELRITNYGLKPAYATGRGEKLKPLPGFKINYPILVVYPGIQVPTKWAYRKVRVQSSKLKVLNSIKEFSAQTFPLLKNDFEDAVFKKYRSVKNIKDKLYGCGAVFSSMSGSGSTVYAVFKESKNLKRCKKYFRKKGYEVYEV